MVSRTKLLLYTQAQYSRKCLFWCSYLIYSSWQKFSFIQVILFHRGFQKLLGLFHESGKCFSFLLSVTTEEASWMRGVLPTVWVTLDDLETPTHCRLLARLSWHRSLLFDVEHTRLTILMKFILGEVLRKEACLFFFNWPVWSEHVDLTGHLLFFYFERLGRDRTGKTKTTVEDSGISMVTSTGPGLYLHFWILDATFLRFNCRMNIST